MSSILIKAHWWQKNLLTWHAVHGRHDLPWQAKSPYAVWISEIMLQQTQVKTVIPYFEEFIHTFPNISALANAPLDKVLQLWAGLGYYARARNLHKTAKIIMAEYAGKIPKDFDKLLSLPGIGRSTAGAILAQSFSIPKPILDGNVKRILLRCHAISGVPTDKTVNQKLWTLTETYTPKRQVAQYTQAIMDLGATICTRTKPNCKICPVHKKCQAFLTDTQHLYPEKKATQPKPTKRCRFLFIEKKGDFLVYQREPKGIWGGLWSAPECPMNKAVETWCEQSGIKATQITKYPIQRHTFTHFYLDYQPIIIKGKITTNLKLATPPYAWYKLNKIDTLGLPAPIHRFFNQIKSNTMEEA